ncbi:hypothetical protein GGR55DRAFT_633467 [Xylaria sp. FL0064]|nr:hypothetical protein GGR55DRAFT_633467 [Xylaria sp. FL0064]
MAKLFSERRSLPAGAAAEMEQLATWMRSEAADFQIEDQIKFCKNTKKLSSVASRLGELFTFEIENLLPSGYSSPLKFRASAIHFEKPTALPVDPGWMIELIPVHIVRGPVEVGDEQHIPNSFFHVSTRTRVSGDFFGLLLMTQYQ